MIFDSEGQRAGILKVFASVQLDSSAPADVLLEFVMLKKQVEAGTVASAVPPLQEEVDASAGPTQETPA